MNKKSTITTTKTEQKTYTYVNNNTQYRRVTACFLVFVSLYFSFITSTAGSVDGIVGEVELDAVVTDADTVRCVL